METADSTDRGVGLAIVFSIVAVLGAIGLAVFGFTGDQLAAGGAFGAAVLGGSLSIAAYHLYA